MGNVLQVKVYGRGCAKCVKTEEIVVEELQCRGLEFILEKVKDLDRIAGAGIFVTPALQIDDTMLFQGEIPRRKDLGEWLDKRKAARDDRNGQS